MMTQSEKATAEILIEEFSGPNEHTLLEEISLLMDSKNHLFFRPGWKNVFEIYRLKYRLWTARQAQRLVGVLPVVEQRSLITGRQLVSLPWFDSAGVLAPDPAVRSQLLNLAVKTAQQNGLALVQLRQQEDLALSSHIRTDKVLMRLDLEKSPDDLWKRLNPKVRNQVRKAEKAGIHIQFGGRELLQDFFTIYSENMRDLGSPSHSLRFFQRILETFPDETCLAVAKVDQRPVGAGLTLANGNCLEIPWASSLRKYNSICVNHGMYWKILERACHQGFDYFHFGRSTVESGTYHFKKQWGAEADQLYWYFSGDDRLAQQATSPPGNDHGMAVKIWRKLPLVVTRFLGPQLISQIP